MAMGLVAAWGIKIWAANKSAYPREIKDNNETSPSTDNVSIKTSIFIGDFPACNV